MKYLVLLFSFAFLFISCEKDTSVIREEVEIEPAEEIVDLVIRGTIIDSDVNPVANATVSIFVNYELEDEIISNDNGQFEYIRIKDTTELIRIQINNSEFDPLLRTIKFNNQKEIDIEFQLPNLGDSGDLANVDPMSKEIVSISGYCFGSTGLPAKLWVISSNPEDQENYSFHAIQTDRKGFYEFFREAAPEIRFSYSERPCNPDNYSFRIDIEDEDIILDDYLSDYTHETVKINMTLLNCNGDPISKGQARLRAYNYSKFTQISRGKFTTDYNTCELIGPKNDFVIRNYDDDQMIVIKDVNMMNAQLDLGEITVCGGPTSVFDVKIDGKPIDTDPIEGEFIITYNDNRSPDGVILLNGDRGQLSGLIWFTKLNGQYLIDRFGLRIEGTQTKWESNGDNLNELKIDIHTLGLELGDFTSGSINGSFINEVTGQESTIQTNFNLFTFSN